MATSKLNRLIWLSPWEFFAVLSVLFVLAGLLLPAVESGRTLTEGELGLTDDWTPGTEQEHEPAESLLAKDTQIVGEWTMAYVYVKISRTSPDRYDVVFNTRAPCRGCILRRSATYREGIIQLDRPVRALHGPTYQRLFAVTREGTEFLLPAAYVTEFESNASTYLDNGTFPRIALSRWRGPFGDE